ncbi:hypothetical protein D3Y57_02835 (plasmid) [Sphingomonas paeninsulae]|uniref:Uncharacterized protein n=2 Tax=Sphingomonas paeninsulae TaxID=2319844 RepID=A0A494T7X1_SPHPE|nr:hypothetical protein D3Y57_02835 [Sphingomonas paeninsulae]
MRCDCCFPNGPYGTNVSAHQLAAMIADRESANAFSAPVQKLFIDATGVDKAKAGKIAAKMSKLSGYVLSLAA